MRVPSLSQSKHAGRVELCNFAAHCLGEKRHNTSTFAFLGLVKSKQVSRKYQGRKLVFDKGILFKIRKFSGNPIRQKLKH